ncbi:MAG TPA: hypothetical protein VFW63_04890 [Acidimicrobiales bacterium]|nr:hypothetical protein [Acidimicrobiales bacterium]
MHVHVTVELDGDQLVVTKSADGAEAATRLGGEAHRLRRASHPGVVTLLDATPRDPAAEPDGPPGPAAGVLDVAGGPTSRLRLAYAGEPVSRWSGPPSAVAGLAVAVATTLADLHDIGIVHGRLDATHVLVAGDGRPRLCGFADPGAATPADDVAAWARLVIDLAERTPAPRRRLRPAGRSAALRALRAAVQPALDPVPERRPAARALADGVLAVVPDANLAASVGGSRAPDATEEGSPTDPFDRIWSYPGEPTEAERWAAALGPGPPDLEGQRGESAAPTPATGWPETGGGDEPTGPAGRIGLDPGSLGLGLGSLGLGLGVPAGSGDLGHLGIGSGVPARRGPAGHGPAGTPPGAVAPTPARRRVRPATALVALVAGAGVLVPVALLGAEGDGEPRATTPTAGCPPVVAPAADVDGDGCREAVTADGASVVAGDARWSLGTPGDVAAVGDWDCDGEAAAALLRPASGEVFVFPGWAAAGQPITVRPVQRVAGGTALQVEADADTGCDRLLVAVSGGDPVAVEGVG